MGETLYHYNIRSASLLKPDSDAKALNKMHNFNQNNSNDDKIDSKHDSKIMSLMCPSNAMAQSGNDTLVSKQDLESNKRRLILKTITLAN
jgi:hypothetical protein